ncbi:MAG: rhodanese-like domain-containing protein [Nanoarchaeota archaeon]
MLSTKMIYEPYNKIYRVSKTQAIVIVLALIFISSIIGAVSSNFIDRLNPEKSQEQLIAEFYAIETAVYVSPHGLRKEIAAGTNKYIIVDLRSQEEYEKEHIIGAVNIPAYKDKDTSDYGSVERITEAFKKIQTENPEKEILVYCYSAPCMTGRKVGTMLAKEGIYVKHLGVGWNEWRYYWDLWNHEHEWSITDVEDYIFKGPGPGIFNGLNNTACPIGGGLGC